MTRFRLGAASLLAPLWIACATPLSLGGPEPDLARRDQSIAGDAAGRSDFAVPADQARPADRGAVPDAPIADGPLGDLSTSDFAQQGCTPKLNELQTAGTGGADDEFVELFNPCTAAFDLTGFRLVYRSAAGGTDTSMITFAAMSIPAGGFFVCGQTNYSGAADARYATSMASPGGAVGLRDATGALVDGAGYGTAANALVETAPAPAPASAKSIERLPDGHDTNDNSKDFSSGLAPTPGATNK